MQPTDKKNVKLLQQRDERIRERNLNQLAKSRGVLGNNPNYNSSIGSVEPSKRENQTSFSGPNSLVIGLQESVTANQHQDSIHEQPATTENSQTKLKSVIEPKKTPSQHERSQISSQQVQQKQLQIKSEISSKNLTRNTLPDMSPHQQQMAKNIQAKGLQLQGVKIGATSSPKKDIRDNVFKRDEMYERSGMLKQIEIKPQPKPMQVVSHKDYRISVKRDQFAAGKESEQDETPMKVMGHRLQDDKSPVTAYKIDNQSSVIHNNFANSDYQSHGDVTQFRSNITSGFNANPSKDVTQVNVSQESMNVVKGGSDVRISSDTYPVFQKDAGNQESITQSKQNSIDELKMSQDLSKALQNNQVISTDCQPGRNINLDITDKIAESQLTQENQANSTSVMHESMQPKTQIPLNDINQQRQNSKRDQAGGSTMSEQNSIENKAADRDIKTAISHQSGIKIRVQKTPNKTGNTATPMMTKPPSAQDPNSRQGSSRHLSHENFHNQTAKLSNKSRSQTPQDYDKEQWAMRNGTKSNENQKINEQTNSMERMSHGYQINQGPQSGFQHSQIIQGFKIYGHGTMTNNNTNRQQIHIMKDHKGHQNGAQTAAKNSMVSLPSGQSQRQGVHTSEGKRRVPVNIKTGPQNSDIEGIISNKKLDVDSSQNNIMNMNSRSQKRKDNEYSSHERAHPFARAMNRPDLMSFKRGSMVVGRQSMQITDMDSTFKVSKNLRVNNTSLGNYVNYNGHKSHLPGIKNTGNRNIIAGKNSFSLSSAARATQSSNNFVNSRNGLNGPSTYNKHESTFTSKPDQAKHLAQIARLNQNSQGGPRVNKKQQVLSKDQAQEVRVDQGSSLPINLISDGISVNSSMPKGIISSFDNNISITKKSQGKNRDGKKSSVAEITIIRSSKVDSQIMDEFKDAYLNNRKDTTEQLDSNVSPSKSPVGHANGVFERLEQTLRNNENSSAERQMPEYLIRRTDDSTKYQKHNDENYLMNESRHASFREKKGMKPINLNNSPQSRRLNHKDKMLDSNIGRERRLSYNLTNNSKYRRDLTRSVLETTTGGPDFSLYNIQKDMSSRRRMDDFVDSKMVQDKSRFYQKNNAKLNDSILDRLIGPSPIDLNNNNILDKDTVRSIKQSRNKVVQENQILKEKISDMANMMEKTSGENQKLRSHIRVLIEDRQSYQGVPKNITAISKFRAPRSQSIGNSIETIKIGALMKQNKDIQDQGSQNDTVNFEYNEGKMFSQPFNFAESIHQSQFSTNQKSFIMPQIPLTSSYELKSDYASGIAGQQKEFEESIMPSHEIKITASKKDGLGQDFTQEIQNNEQKLQQSFIRELIDSDSPTVIRQKETISANQTPISKPKFPPVSHPLLAPQPDVFINTMLQNQENEAKLHLETDIALSNAFKVTDIIKDELFDANKDIEDLRQKLMEQSYHNKRLMGQNFELKDKLNQYRRQIIKQEQDDSSEDETHSLMQQSKATADISPRRELFKAALKGPPQKIDLTINLRELEDRNQDLRSRESFIDDQLLGDEDKEELDGVGDLDDEEDQDRKRFSELLKMQREASMFSHKPRSSVLKTSQQFTGASGLSGQAQDLVAECISLMIERSHNARQLFFNLETALLKIMGKFCTGVHFMIADPEFGREIKASDKGLNQFLFRQLIVSSDVVELVHIKRPPQHPFHERKKKKSKETLIEEIEAHKAAFSSFLPDFSQVSKVESMAMVKNKSVIFPVHKLRKKSSVKSQPLRSDLKMLIQLDIPREKIAQSIQHSTPNPQQNTTSNQRRQSLALQKQPTSLQLKKQNTSVISSNAADKAAVLAAQEELSQSIDYMKQIRLVTNCFMITFEQIKQEKRANYNESRVSQILAVIKIFMKCKRHQELYDELQTHLPALFGYTNTGVLFYDENGGNLFSIRCNDYKTTVITDEHMMHFPLKMGITGIAIDEQSPFISNEGEEDPRYSFEVDNHLQLLDFENLLVVPLIDSQGKLKGAIQMVNKIGMDEIPQTDVIEFSQIAQSIAETLNFCNLSKSVSDVSDGLVYTMKDVVKNIDGSYQHFRQPQLPEVMYHLDQIQRVTKDLVLSKREGAFGHGTLVQKIFDDMQKKQQKEINEKRKNLVKQMNKLGQLSGMGVAVEKEFCVTHGEQSFKEKK